MAWAPETEEDNSDYLYEMVNHASSFQPFVNANQHTIHQSRIEGLWGMFEFNCNYVHTDNDY